jgi:hypothetical protein
VTAIVRGWLGVGLVVGLVVARACWSRGSELERLPRSAVWAKRYGMNSVTGRPAHGGRRGDVPRQLATTWRCPTIKAGPDLGVLVARQPGDHVERSATVTRASDTVMLPLTSAAVTMLTPACSASALRTSLMSAATKSSETRFLPAPRSGRRGACFRRAGLNQAGHAPERRRPPWAPAGAASASRRALPRASSSPGRRRRF